MQQFSPANEEHCWLRGVDLNLVTFSSCTKRTFKVYIMVVFVVPISTFVVWGIDLEVDESSVHFKFKTSLKRWL